MDNSLDHNATDHAVALTKAALGMVPVAGSFLAELAGTVIPRQRADRLADYARGLADELASIDQQVLRSKLNNENFTDLLEEGAREAVRSVSGERREYIAKLISSGLAEDKVTYLESKHLLRLLSHLNDVEIIWLRFYDYPMLSGDEEFRKKHESVLAPVRATLGSGPDLVDKEALQQNYVERLVSLGLLSRPLLVDSKTRLPVFDPQRGEWKTKGRRTTPLGRLLLRHIGIAARDNAA
jgi:hypothetical protein